MANIAIKNSDDILFRALDTLSSETQLTRTSAGSKVRSIMKIVSKELEITQAIMQANVAMSVISGASGPYLDVLGDILGVRRSGGTSAGYDSESTGLRVSAPGGMTFGEMNSGQNIDIPVGTLVTNSSGSKYYRTTSSATLFPGESTAYINVIATDSGSQANISADELSVINFSSYTSASDIQLQIGNASSITNGEDPEEDSLYRYRLQSALTSAESSNSTAVRLAVLSVPGVRNVTVLDMVSGVGTATVMIETDGEQASPEVISAVSRTVEDVKALGTRISITEPDNVGLDLSISITIANPLQLAEIARAIRTRVSGFVQGVSIGGSVSINMLSSAVVTAHPDIISIGMPGKPIDTLMLWRKSAYSTSRVPFRASSDANIILRSSERLILEGGMSEAIRIVSR
jgi:uncharacterized phage protein gp47/JayE